MAKTEEELNELKKEYQTLVEQLSELTEEEFENVTGGAYPKDIGADKNAKVIYK